MHALAKFQRDKEITLRVTALQSSNNRKSICTASIGKINYRSLLSLSRLGSPTAAAHVAVRPSVLVTVKC